MDVGFFVDHFGKRHREAPAAILTSLLLGLGWLCLGWAAWSGQAPFVVGGIAFYLVGHGNFFAFVAPLRANAWNFGPARKGAVDGVLLGGFGISSAVFGQIYHIIFGASHIAEFMIMLAGLCVLIALASSVLTKRIQEDGTTEDPSLDDGGIAVPPLSMLRTLSFWRLWLVLACSGGANVFFVQSAAKLAMGTSMTSATLVAFFSIAGNVLSASICSSFLVFNWSVCSQCSRPLRWWLLMQSVFQTCQLPVRVVLLLCLRHTEASGLRLEDAIASLTSSLAWSTWIFGSKKCYGND